MLTQILNIKNLIYSSGTTDGLGDQLLTELQNFLPENEISRCNSIDALAYLLLPLRSRTASRAMIIVLFITSDEELQNIYEFRDLLEDINLLIVLPEEKQDLEEMAKDLRPGFISNGADLSPILEEIANLRSNLLW